MGGPVAARSIEDRFWSKVDRSAGPDGCWPWTAGANHERGGYGVFHPQKHTTVGAHRFALELHLGRPLGKGMQARHRVCDNPPCCNPAHLSEGSNADNVADMVGKGRQARGVKKITLARLDDQQVIELRERVAAGEKIRSEAERLGVTESLASMIVRGKRWAHVGGPRTYRYRKAMQNG